MARIDSGLRVATTLFEAAAWHHAIQPVCRCGHSAVFNPHGLWWLFDRKRWPDHLADARRRFWCRSCRDRLQRKVQPVTLDLVRESKGDIRLALPPEAAWRRALSRFRA